MPEIGKKHHTTHEDGGNDEITAAGLAGRVNIVDRGDLLTPDFTQADLIFDFEYHDLDLSSIIPVGAIDVLLSALIKDSQTWSELWFRHNGDVGIYNSPGVVTQAANVAVCQDMRIKLDSNRVIEYMASPTTTAVVEIVVRGWTI